MRKDVLFKISLIFNLVLILLIGRVLDYRYLKLIDFRSHNIENDLIYKRTKQASTNLQASLPIQSGDIVFIGNSLTESFPVGEMFNSSKIKNRGINGNTNRDILKRIDDIARFHPSKIFLMSGVNDLYRDQKSVDESFEIFKQIITTIENISPKTKIYIQSVLPVWDHPEVNSKILDYNSRQKKLASENDINYIDLYNEFLSGSQLDFNLTTDGQHLNEKGYFKWRKGLLNYINSK